MIYLRGTPVGVITPTGLYYVYADHIDTPRVIARHTDHAIVWRWDEAEAFGATPPNESPNGVGSFSFNLRFPGQVYDRETGLFYNVNRDYRPSDGRYVQADPIGQEGGLNLFTYARGRPISNADPLGLFPCTCGPFGCVCARPPMPGPFVLDEPRPASVPNYTIPPLVPNIPALCQTMPMACAMALSTIAMAEMCKEDDPCDIVLNKDQTKAAGVRGKEHEVKADELGTNKNLSKFDLCGCKDGRVVVKRHGCKGPIISVTNYRWK